MAKSEYGIISWYIEKKGFNLSGIKLDKNRESSKNKATLDFYEKAMDYAISKATGKQKDSLSSLKNDGSFKNPHLSQIRGEVDTQVESMFNDRLIDLANKSKLSDEKKNELIDNVPDYNEEDGFIQAINEQLQIEKFAEKESERVEKEEIQKIERVQQQEESRLRKEGSVTTLYKNKIKSAKTINEVDYILNKASGELKEGKNLDALSEMADYRKGRIERETEENERRQEESRLRRQRERETTEKGEGETEEF